MAKHWHSREEIAAFVAGDLPDDARAMVLEHLARCEDCREELARHEDGMLSEPESTEQQAYKRFEPASPAQLMADIDRRAAGASGGRPTIVDWILGVPGRWSLAASALAVVGFVLLWPTGSERAELDRLYAMAGEHYPEWAGSPGRLVQPFAEEPAEPVRGIHEPSTAADDLKPIEDDLVRLQLSRADERRERDAAVAVLRLARGEYEAAWQVLRELASNDPTPMTLGALGCAALALGTEDACRFAVERIDSSGLRSKELLYDSVLLHLELGEFEAARARTDEYREIAGADDPWLAQLEAALIAP